MRPHEQLENLVIDFARDVQTARSLVSPNSEDELAIKVAIVGFSHNAPTEEWEYGHYAFVKKRLDGDYSFGSLLHYEQNAEKIRLFAALCFGCLLDLYQVDRITDEEFQQCEFQIPGLIALRNESLAGA